MDEIVKQAMSKWPNVPHCFGWLGLDARGNWYMRDESAQQKGSFTESKGSKLTHEKLIAFIQRNYQSDTNGQWYFQNGPQRVYVELEATPWIWRIQNDGTIQTHTGENARVQRCLIDEEGRVYLDTEKGIGLVHSQDVIMAVDPIENGLWVPQEIRASDIPKQFGYVTSPEKMNRLTYSQVS
jgi:hypothetical protein